MNPLEAPQYIYLNPEKANYATILHEMGHVVGLRHEFARPDAKLHVKSSCIHYLKSQVESTVVPVGHYDEESIMNYDFIEYESGRKSGN